MEKQPVRLLSNLTADLRLQNFGAALRQFGNLLVFLSLVMSQVSHAVPCGEEFTAQESLAQQIDQIATKPRWSGTALQIKEHYREIRSTKITSLFPDEKVVNSLNQQVKRTVVSASQQKAYFRLFDTFLEYSERGYGPQYSAKKFRKWLATRFARPYPPMNVDELDMRFKIGDSAVGEGHAYTFEQFIQYYYDQFIDETKNTPSQFWVYTQLASEHPFARVVRAAFLNPAVSFIVGTLVLSFRINFPNAFFNRPTALVYQVFGQLGNITWGPLAQAESRVYDYSQFMVELAKQKIMMEKSGMTPAQIGKISYQNAQAIANQFAATNFNELTPEQRQERAMYYTKEWVIALKSFKNSYPDDYQSGRGLLRDFMYDSPAAHVNNFESALGPLLMAEHFQNDILGTLASEHRTATPAEQKLLNEYQMTIDVSGHAIAENFVAILLKNDQYPEVAKGADGSLTVDGQVNQGFNRTLQAVGIMRFAPYFAQEMKEVTAAMAPGLPYKASIYTTSDHVAPWIVKPGSPSQDLSSSDKK